jgi:hypothetical protein
MTNSKGVAGAGIGGDLVQAFFCKRCSRNRGRSEGFPLLKALYSRRLDCSGVSPQQ